MKSQNETSPSTALPSFEKEKQHESSLRMIRSQDLTAQMCLMYLAEWHNNQHLLEALLIRLHDFLRYSAIEVAHPTCYLMNLYPNQLFEVFVKEICSESLSTYLLIKWGFKSYAEIAESNDSNTLFKRIDTIYHKRFSAADFQDLSENDIQKMIQSKAKRAQHLQIVEEFYEKLFILPIKLKRENGKKERNKKLCAQLEKLMKWFNKEDSSKNEGIPIPGDSNARVFVNIAIEKCFTFSTKQRVPFKLVLQTILPSEIASKEDSETGSDKRILGPKRSSHSLQGDAIANAFRQSFSTELQNGVDSMADIPLSVQFSDSDNSSPYPSQIISSYSSLGSEPLILPESYFGKLWNKEEKDIRSKSLFTHFESYEVQAYMIKSGDDLRQQYLAMQIIRLMNEICEKENLRLWVCPYKIIPYSADSGLIQFVNDTRTVSDLKEASYMKDLRSIYIHLFGHCWDKAITNFVQSLAGYSLLQYFLKIKDRHNNNILIDTNGHIIHIDFSFMLSSSPGDMNFENAPFKLTTDYMDLMEGTESDLFNYFKQLLFLGIKFMRKYVRQFTQILKIMKDCPLKCMEKGQVIFQSFERRFHLTATDEELQKVVQSLINRASGSYRTSNYDRFQQWSNSIVK